ncbi:MAG TPA: Zn-dependent alcohol dehydrogenase [Acidimicrobiia bacterium]|nr:Zn-dependent alcohol dehydrogenase [Acidimicrobiia bacterium]
MKITTPVLVRPGEPMQMLDLDIDEPGPGEVRVKMAASGVCHSCLHAYDGSHTGMPMPIVLGDEGSGVVESVGAGCTRLKPGDHVIISWAPDCGACKYCALGFPGLCLNGGPAGKMRDGSTRFHHEGTDVNHYGPATYGPYIVVPEAAAVEVRKDFPLDLAALIGCSVTTGFGAVVNTAGVRAGQSVAVFGCGGIGLNSIQAAAVAGAYPIIGIDVLDSKLEYAKEFGATHTINLATQDLMETITALTGHGVDASFVAVGNTRAMEQGLEVLAKQGIEVIIGMPGTGETFSVNPRLLLVGERRVMGSRYGSGNPMVEFPKMVELAMAGRLKVAELVTKRYALDEADEAFRALAAGEQARGLIVF